MKFSVAAVLAAAAGAHAWSNVTYVTEVVTAVTTFCPGPTQITYGGTTYTITEATTLTITDCPCTVTKPVSVISSVACHTCTVSAAPTSSVPLTTAATTAATTTSALPTAGAGRVAALSGAGLAGVLGLAAFVL
ncbi:hypothetical protein B0T26DRAFT_673006 [Lasiosphaeria miniovina]|uniref:Clock-controlled protein 6 n=1 Tax=Lasiosphaeria miniovina TaxID=1954250 RepID=A0AA40B6I1_9PEZI|nr:uncharacterized protein B0T26DRAFT_673006 [Lasiosphaeria miniovina]KAK0728484.1 hypothetical protein B0T26DRAFT_673006 [Lasiosphaeria miniovina]